MKIKNHRQQNLPLFILSLDFFINPTHKKHSGPALSSYPYIKVPSLPKILTAKVQHNGGRNAFDLSGVELSGAGASRPRGNSI